MLAPNPHRSSLKRSRRALAFVLAALALTARVVFAADAQPAPKVTERACHLPQFDGKLETVVEPEDCSSGRCQREFDVSLLTPDRTIIYGVKGALGHGDPPLPSLACTGRYVVLRWRGQQLRLELEHDHLLKLAAADGRRVSELWKAPAAQSPKELGAHVSLRAILELAYTGPFGMNSLVLEGIDESIIELAELVVIRDQLRGGDLRFVGGVPRKLRAPFETGGPPELFFRGSELCVADAPSRMRCFAPDATEARDPEPLVLPANGSGGTRLSSGKSSEGSRVAERALVSPDARWVVAQVGKPGDAVSLWVFPTARPAE
jgi:hypothetical protein